MASRQSFVQLPLGFAPRPCAGKPLSPFDECGAIRLTRPLQTGKNVDGAIPCARQNASTLRPLVCCSAMSLRHFWSVNRCCLTMRADEGRRARRTIASPLSVLLGA